MSKSSFVLRSLRILGLNEILKLTEVLHVKQTTIKKAAGEDLIVWDDAPPAYHQEPEKEAQVLQFPKKKTINELPAFQDHTEEIKKDEPGPSIITSDLVLWQREVSRSSEASVHKLDAFKGYRRSTEMYVVKSSTPEGKEKIRFASTNGVLVNKKQA